MKKQQVVIVDDDPDTIGLLQMLLEEMLGAEAIPARNGIEALERIAQTLPAAVVIDIRMPELDGLAVIRQLKADPSTRDIPTIVLTGLSRIDEAMAAGCDDYIEKPFELDAFLSVLRKHLNRRRYVYPNDLAL